MCSGNGMCVCVIMRQQFMRDTIKVGIDKQEYPLNFEYS